MHWILFSILHGCSGNESQTKAYQITSMTQTIGGSKALAREGDFILENEKIRVAIIGNRPSMGPHTMGGTMIDADLQRSQGQYANGNGSDEFSELYTTVNMNVALINGVDEEGDVRVLSKGSNTEPAIICTSGRAYPYNSLLQALWGFTGWLDSDFKLPYTIRTDYELYPNDEVLTLRTTLFIGDNDGCEEDISDAVLAQPADSFFSEGGSLIDLALDQGFIFGDFYLSGAQDVFMPNVGFDESGFLYDLQLKGANTFKSPIPVNFFSGSGDNVSYGLMYPKGDLYVPSLVNASTVATGAYVVPEEGAPALSTRLPEGSVIQYERWFTVGKGDTGSVVTAFLRKLQSEAAAKPEEYDAVQTASVSGFVYEENTGLSISDASVFVYQVDENGQSKTAPWIQYQTDVGDDTKRDGSFSGVLPVSESGTTYEFLVHKKGRPDSKRYRKTLSPNQEAIFSFESPMPGTVRFEVQDEVGMHLPAKVMFYSLEDTSSVDPVLGDGFIYGNPNGIVFVVDGHGVVSLPPGRYYAVASRGLEYEIDYSDEFVVKANSDSELNFTLLKSVDTQGWLSADFHVHSYQSHDSGILPQERVSSMAAEGVEFFVTTEHDFVADFRPAIEELGLEYWVQTMPGLEVSTTELGHYLGFPLKVDRALDASGALDWTGMEPQEILDAIREEKPLEVEDQVIAVAHPRDGIFGYFDQYGLNTYRDENKEFILNDNIMYALPSMDNIENALLLSRENFSTDFDALEILNAKRFELIRTPTITELKDYKDELDAYLQQQSDAGLEIDPHDLYEINKRNIFRINTRTMAEQQALKDGSAVLASEEDLTPTDEMTVYAKTHQGQVDDWFSLLNLGFVYTAMGNSDAHSTTRIESGYPRNYVMVSDDNPITADPDVISRAVKEGRLVTSYGPFVEFYVTGDPSLSLGDTIQPTDGQVSFDITVQSPSWFDVGRIEVYRNGELVHEIDVVAPNESVVNHTGTFVDEPTVDSWYVVIVTGTETSDLNPISVPLFRPKIQLNDVVIEALRDSVVSNLLNFLEPTAPIPRTFPTVPYALTNPIWVDVDGNGEIEPPGIPEWAISEL